MSLQTGKQLIFGKIKGPDVWLPVSIGASEVIKWASGRFVKADGSGRVEIAVDGTAEIIGWLEAEIGEGTASSTEGATKGVVNPSLNAVYRIPINAGTYVASMQFKTCDLAVSSNIQGAKLDASGEDTIMIVDGDLVNNEWVDVILNPSKRGQTGVV